MATHRAIQGNAFLLVFLFVQNVLEKCLYHPGGFMNVSPSNTQTVNRYMTERSELNMLFDQIQIRMNEAKKVMPGIKLDHEVEIKNEILEIFRTNLSEAGDNSELIKKSVVVAREALENLAWELDKHITFAQLNIIYIRVMLAAEIAPDADIDLLEKEANAPVYIQFVKEARQILEVASSRFETIKTRKELEEVANQARVGISQVKSTIIKENMFDKIQVLVDQVLKHTPVEYLPNIQEATTTIVADARELLKIGNPQQIVTPERAAQIFVGVSKALTSLNPKT